MGRTLAFACYPAYSGPGASGAAARRAGLPQIRAARRHDVDQSARVGRAGAAVRRGGRAGGAVRGGLRRRRPRAGRPHVGPRRPGPRVRALDRRGTGAARGEFGARRRAGVRGPQPAGARVAQVPVPRPGAAADAAARRLARHARRAFLRRGGGAALACGLAVRRSLPGWPVAGRRSPNMPESVRYDLAEGVATITLDRPDAMNSLTVAVKTELGEAVERARDDPAARAVILPGSGRAFSVGQGLREHADNLDAGRGLAGTQEDHYAPIVSTLAGLPQPD